jgi:hypothetical protein
VKWLNALTIVSCVIFLFAMTQAAFYQNRPAEPVTHSVLLLATGWLGVLIGYFEWIANPLIFYSWICARRKRILPALLASIAAVGLILSFLFHKKMEWPGGDRHAPGYPRICVWLLAIGCGSPVLS